MKNYRLLITLLIILMIAGCAQTGGESGELIGATRSRGSWFEPVPYGMTFIPRGTLRVGPSDEDISGGLNPTITVSIDAFWMDDTEITNNKYRQFTNWVRDSIARTLLYNSAHPNAEFYGRLDLDGNYLGLNWRERINWKDPENHTGAAYLADMFIPENERFFGKIELDARIMFFDYAWIDLQRAAIRANSYNYETQSYGGDINDRSDFIVRNRVNVYPDTLVWIRDFTYAYNEPLARTYYWHPGFDDYPLVGVTWEQANAFSHWRSKMQNDYFSQIGDATVMEYRLPNEFEWEYAARGGLQNSMYPWGGYYSRNQRGEFMANYKPMRGNYIEDGGLSTMRVAEYPPNDYGLYDMAGNVAEWTRTAYDELTLSMVRDFNPDYTYNAQPGDPPALKRKVIRGGSWKDVGYFIQVSTRTFEYQDSATSYIGFRCVRSSFGNNF